MSSADMQMTVDSWQVNNGKWRDPSLEILNFIKFPFIKF